VLKIVMLNMLLLATTSAYNMDGAASETLSEYEKLIQHVIERYRLSEDEARYLLAFCNDLQCPEDFKKHAFRQDFERHFIQLNRIKKRQSSSKQADDIE